MKIACILSVGLLFAVQIALAQTEAEFPEPGWFRSRDRTVPQQKPPAWTGALALGGAQGGSQPMSLLSGPAIAEAITPEIEALARGLESDPKRIFDYVHDHIRYVHYFGSKKGAQLTLLERCGNDFDQCALLVALLRAAGYSAFYSFGLVYMPYERQDERDLKHWLGLTKPETNVLEAVTFAVNLSQFRGFPDVGAYYPYDGTDNLWLHRIWVRLDWNDKTYWLDPAFKVIHQIPGITNLATAMGLDTNELMTAAGGTSTANYVQSMSEVNLRNKLRDYTTNLLAYFQNNHANASVMDILGGQSIVTSINDPLNDSQFGLPFGLTATTYASWDYIPTNLMTSLNVTVANTNKLFLMPELQGQKLALTFSNNGLAQLWLEDELALQKQTSSGSTIQVVLAVDHPHGTWDRNLNTLINTNWHDQTAIASYRRTNASYVLHYAFEPHQEWLRQRQERLDHYRQAGLADTSREVVTETLNVMGLSWLVQAHRLDHLLATEQDMLVQFHHQMGRMAQELGRGYYVDIYAQLDGSYPASGTSPSDSQRRDRLFDLDLYFASAAEHAVIQQLQSTNLVAASTVRMLQIGHTNGQRIFQASSTNWSSIQASLLNYDKNWLKTNYIDRGYTLLLPANGSNHVAGAGSWAGYGIAARRVGADSITMAMLISGSYHGGYVSDPSVVVDTSFVSQFGYDQPGYFRPSSALTVNPYGADPVSMTDGAFDLTATDLALGQAEPRGITLSRHYSSSRRHHNSSGMAHGWVHSYRVKATELSAPLAGLGDTTPAQMAALIVATRAALALYSTEGDPKNWTMTALIAKWGLDQLINNAVSVAMGKDAIQFTRRPDGGFTPPAGSTMSLLKTNGAYWLLERHGNTFMFNPAGLLTNIMDQYGQSLRITYTTSNWIHQVFDWKNRTLTFTYSGTPSRLTSVTDGTRTVRYGYTNTYNSQGDLVSFTDAESKTSAFVYDAEHQVIATRNALSQIVVSNAYDGFGRVTEQYSQGDSNQTWRFYWSGFVNTEEDPAGSRRRFFFDEKTRNNGYQDALGYVSQSVYDGQDHVVLTVSPLLETNWFEFDGRHNHTRSIDPLGYTNSFNFDSQDRLMSTVDALGNPTTFGYNSKFQVTGITNGAGDWVTFAYNAGDGTLTSRTDPAGTTSYGYDNQGYLTSVTYPNSLGTEGFLNSTYGDVLSHTNGRGFVTSFQYSARRELTNTIAPTNLTAKVAYDAAANPQSHTDARGFTTTSFWSPTRKLLGTVLPATPQGTPATTNFYDVRDWLAQSLDPLQAVTSYTNDAAGRRIAQADPLFRPTWFGLDPAGRRTFATNAALEVTRQEWSPRGELTKLTDGALHAVGRGYDAAGNQVLLTNRNGKVWQFQFDKANRLTNTITPLNRETKLAYDGRGLVSTVREPSGQTATNYYDSRGRLTNRADSVGSILYRYDANNNRIAVIETGKTNSWGFDAYDRVTAFTNQDGYVIQYRSDANGNVTNLVYPGNRNVFYAFDSLNRLTNVTDWASRKTSFEYDLANRLKKITRPNGTVREMNYDAAGQMTNLWEKTAMGTPIAMFKLNWNDAARVEWEFAAPKPHAYTPPTRTIMYDDDNRVATFNGQSVTHDLDGNMTYGPGTNNTLANYSFDARNRLLALANLQYGYDAIGNRTWITNGANVTRFVVNPSAALSQVLMRIRPGVTNFYIYGAGLLYEITETATNTATATYHYDYRGSTVAITDGSGNVTDRIEYSAYGSITYRAGTNDTPFLFNGRYGVQTDLNGLLYMRARYYNPYICRFISADPSGFEGGLNFYAYADGNPVSSIDPLGLQSWMSPGYGSLPNPVNIVPANMIATSPDPSAYFVQGLAIGALGAGVVVVAAPVAVSGLVAVGFSETAAAATVTVGVGATAVVGGYSTGRDIVNNANAGNWNNVTFDAGMLTGGFVVGISGGGRAMAEGIMGRPSPAPDTWNPITVLQYEWSARYQSSFPEGSLPSWMASAPTPASGGASAAFTASGGGLFLQPSAPLSEQQYPQGSWITPSISYGAMGQPSTTGK